MTDLKPSPNKNSIFKSYPFNKVLFDEIFKADGKVAKHYQKIINHFSKLSVNDYKKLDEFAKITFFNQGVTFAVYSDNLKGVERILPK